VNSRWTSHRFFDQDKKFYKSVRNTDPCISSEKILVDSFLTFIYEGTLDRQLQDLDFNNRVLELGSAGGITKLKFPWVITSDVRQSPGVDIVLRENEKLPFEDRSFDRVICKDVLHHISDPKRHFEEMLRILISGGKVVYTEPNWNFFSRVIYKFLHPEPFCETQKEWNFENLDPMHSNQALPWIIFIRDADIFHQTFPDFVLEIDSVPTNAFSYLISGGVFKRNRVPSKFLIPLSKFENRNQMHMKFFGLSRTIEITKV
jgi:SAM-dependent methyltransferase